MRLVIIVGTAGVLALVSCGVKAPPDPPSTEWANHWPAPPGPPPPPPGERDEKLESLPQPLSVPDARRVLVEATIYAPWGFGFHRRPMQALAINVLLEQPNPVDTLKEIYRSAELPGRLLALCALNSADPARFTALAEPYEHSQEEVPYYEDCNGWDRTAAELISEMRTTSVCSDIPKLKERIVAQFKRAG